MCIYNVHLDVDVHLHVFEIHIVLTGYQVPFVIKHLVFIRRLPQCSP